MLTEITIVITAAFSLYALMGNPELLEKFLLRPFRDSREGRYYTLITSAFLHSDIFHLMFNMITLYFFGPAVEYTIGGFGFAGIYFTAILAASGISFLKNRDNPAYGTLGASGGTSGIVFASVLFYPQSSIYMFLIPIPIPAPIFALAYLGYTYYASKKGNDGVNHDAHLYGALAGITFAIFAKPDSVFKFFHYILAIFR
ncbi:peptidase, S54 family [Leptospira fainei serovar Hurstbridge str. BUT 6]|uniref:Peptidase, S54 family n=1 Tax=Leptospira fainei serovar Hurstbridge str. BUT 6 TaxID=1193011 RepID=S3VXY6_9LEPT|nr:rhomboid family intramembrane serine protease [Leptospira fainei]EPG72982.1 peptidase, S54 family [Leptospira fainei serovar Hurstbridge str. BUT 6]